MPDEFKYDDRNLQRLFAEMDPKRRLQALKGGFRREAASVRKTAVGNLRRCIRSDADLEKGVRALVFKSKLGFRVTVGTKRASRKTGKGERGFHRNRRGLKKPVLIWADMGTKERRTKGGRRGKGHGTGRMRQYGFMAKTAADVKDPVTDSLHRHVAEYVYKTARKYGCR